MAERSARQVPPPGGYQGEPLYPDDPRTIGAYPVLGRLGAGGMGTVYLARDSAGRLVAIKVIRADLAADPEFRARFGDEVAAARRVAPFCTAQVIDADPRARHPYLVTEYIDGVRLDEAVAESGPLPLSTLQGVAIGVASALTAIHKAGIVHRDLKPSNVLLSYSGPRVIDFGIARALDATSGRTQTGLVLGSVGWMAPEQMEGAKVGPAADVFSWGLLIAYAATGGHPYGDGTYYEMSEKILTGSPDLRAVPPDLHQIVHSALSRDPQARPSAERLLLALLGDHGRVADTRIAATEVLDGTWPRGRSAAAAAAGGAAGGLRPDGSRAPADQLDPTRVAGPYEQRPWWEETSREAPAGPDDRRWEDSRRGLPPPAGPPVPPPVLAQPQQPQPQQPQPQQPQPPAPGPWAGQPPAGPRAPRRRRGGGYVQYDDQPEAPRPQGAPAPLGGDARGGNGGYGGDNGHPAWDAQQRHAGRAPAAAPRPPVEQRPPGERRPVERRPAPEPARRYPPAQPAAARREPPVPVAEERSPRGGPAPAPYAEPARRPRPRRRFRLRIPFKKTIIFVVLVVLLLSAADQIATMVDEQRQRLWDRAVTAVTDGTNDRIDDLWNQTKDVFRGSSDGSSG